MTADIDAFGRLCRDFGNYSKSLEDAGWKRDVLTGEGRMGYSFDLAEEAAILGDGVTVAQQFLVLLVQVRILIPQVFLKTN
jgi:DNA-binding transcriptional LysR family regulator